VLKTDIKKEEKLDLETSRKDKFETINSNVEQLVQLPNEIDLKYAEIRRIEQEIEEIHSKMDGMGRENETLYTEVEEIDNKVSEIENYIDESEWKIELDSHEEMTFNNIKQKLVIEKRLNYGNI
jgi:predicted  nucleic acid-binding Zn-ribbon protein